MNGNDEVVKVNASIKLDELKTFFLLLSLLSKVSKDTTFEFSEIDRNSAEGITIIVTITTIFILLIIVVLLLLSSYHYNYCYYYYTPITLITFTTIITSLLLYYFYITKIISKIDFTE